MKFNIFKIIIFFFSTQLGFTQEFDKIKLDNYFDMLEVHNKFMGSVAISKGEQLIYTKSVGFSDVEAQVKNTESTKYRIGSISKTFTAVLILKAVEQKKLKLNETLHKFFPTIKNAEQITIEQLLLHRSGIFSLTSDKDYFHWYLNPKNEKEVIALISSYEPVFKPDSKSEYSNSNYILLSYIVEKIFKKPFSQVVSQYISQPIGLKNTYLGGEINPKNSECKSYFFDNGWKTEKETNLSFVLGAGGMVSTATDLVKFSEALFGGKLLKKETLQQMQILKDNFAMGLFQFPFYEQKAYGHTGGIDGFASILLHFDANNISYVRVGNAANINLNDIDVAVLSAVFSKPYTIPDFQQGKPEKVTSASEEKYVGVYASANLPLKITIFKNEERLMAQASGQSAFELEIIETDKFKFEPAGIVIEFIPNENKLILKQGGGVFRFTKE